MQTGPTNTNQIRTRKLDSEEHTTRKEVRTSPLRPPTRGGSMIRFKLLGNKEEWFGEFHIWVRHAIHCSHASSIVQIG